MIVLAYRTRGSSVKSATWSSALWIGVFCLVATGCAVPVMTLQHRAALKGAYTIRDARIRVEPFVDQRPPEEVRVGQMAINSLTPRVWSGDTRPPLVDHFRQVIEQEALRTRLFSPGAGEMALSGKIDSMKVERTSTIANYLLFIAEFPRLDASVSIEAQLTRNGDVVMSKRFISAKTARYWALTEFSVQQASDRAQVVLDEAITDVVGQLFQEIDDHLK